MNKLITAIALISATAAHALPLDFDGAGGSPVTVTLDGKIAYTLTGTVNSQTLAFVFQGGTPALTNFASGTQLADVDLYFTINSAPYQFQLVDTLSTRFGNTTALNFTSVDSVTLGIGDVVTLWGGSATTAVGIYGTIPTGGDFTTFLFPVGGMAPAATTGIYTAAAVPEPAAFAALAGLSVLTLAATRRRSR